MRRKLLWVGGVVVALYLITGLVGVPAVVRQMPELVLRELADAARASGRATESDISELSRYGVEVHIHGAVAVFPFVVLVTYDSSVGNRGFPRATRAVLWSGLGVRFLPPGLTEER